MDEPNPNSLAVDRCICFDLSFAELKRIAAAGRLDFEALQRATRCSTNCALCEPYIRLMLATGRTAFSVLAPVEVDRILREARDGRG